MTPLEFAQRTAIMPSAKEFRIITCMYLTSEVDKDEFCKLWCKMHPQRVRFAKEQKRLELEQFKKVYDNE